MPRRTSPSSAIHFANPAFPTAVPAAAESVPAMPSPAPPAQAHNASAPKKEHSPCLVPLTLPPAANLRTSHYHGDRSFLRAPQAFISPRLYRAVSRLDRLPSKSILPRPLNLAAEDLHHPRQG